MKLSAKAEHACLAVLELALRHDRTEPARLVEIAGPNARPERFLVQILLQSALKSTISNNIDFAHLAELARSQSAETYSI